MADEMSLVELLQAAAAAARGGDRPQGGSWLLGELGEAIGALLDKAAVSRESAERAVAHVNANPISGGPVTAEQIEDFAAPEARWVARVLLGVPNGR